MIIKTADSTLPSFPMSFLKNGIDDPLPRRRTFILNDGNSAQSQRSEHGAVFLDISKAQCNTSASQYW